MTNVVGVLAYPLGPDFGAAAFRRYSLLGIYLRGIRNRANPRSPAYMEELFAERYPDGRLVNTPPAEVVDELVLLYPDAIGLGFSRLERSIPASTKVTVLNGRRRSFPLDAKTRRALRFRRALERTYAVEMGLLAVGAILTPLLLLADLARKRT